MDHSPKPHSKRRIWGLLACLALVGLLSAATLAFRTAQVETVNVLTFGNVKILLLESMEQGGQELVLADGYSSPLSEGADLSRIVRVRNVGDEPTWVRLRPRLLVEDSEGGKATAEHQPSFALNEQGWLQAEDGWWYCREALGPGQTSVPALTSLSFPAGSADALGEGERYVLELSCEGVQTKNNGASVEESTGWPQGTEANQQ